MKALAVRFVGEAFDRLGAAALGDGGVGVLVCVSSHGDAGVAVDAGVFVDGGGVDLGEIGGLKVEVHAGAGGFPWTECCVPVGQTDRGEGHRAAWGEQRRPEEAREARQLTDPRRLGSTTRISARRTRCVPRIKDALVLEEVKVAPARDLGVVDGVLSVPAGMRNAGTLQKSVHMMKCHPVPSTSSDSTNHGLEMQRLAAKMCLSIGGCTSDL